MADKTRAEAFLGFVLLRRLHAMFGNKHGVESHGLDVTGVVAQVRDVGDSKCILVLALAVRQGRVGRRIPRRTRWPRVGRLTPSLERRWVSILAMGEVVAEAVACKSMSFGIRNSRMALPQNLSDWPKSAGEWAISQA